MQLKKDAAEKYFMEHQNYLDPVMVLRALDYTLGEYIRQKEQIQAEHMRKRDLTGDEYISRFSLRDRLKPVQIYVIYYSEKEWKGARNLRDLIDWKGIPETWRESLSE